MLIVVSDAVMLPEIYEELETLMPVLAALKSASSLLEPETPISRSLFELKPVALPSQEPETVSLLSCGRVTVILAFEEVNGMYLMLTLNVMPDWRISTRSRVLCGAEITTL